MSIATITDHTNINTTPPSAPDAEQAIIGAALLQPAILDDLTAIISGPDFYQPAHETLWNTIAGMHLRGEIIDPITVADRLDPTTLTGLGGPTYLVDCIQQVTVTADAPAWAEIVHHRAVQRRTQDAAQRINQLASQGNLGPQALIDAAQKTLDQIDPTTRHTTATIADRLEHVINHIGQTETAGLPTPWPDLNAHIGGLKPGRLYVIGGRPGEGKSMLAQNIAEHAANSGHHVLLSTVEMSHDEVALRMIAHEAQVNLATLQGTHITDRDWQAITAATTRMVTSAGYLHVDDSPAQTVTTIRATVRDLQRRHGLAMVAVDYLQLLTPLGGRASSRSREQEVAEMSRLFKLMAKDLNLPVILLSQLNRALTARADKKPTMSDLRESGAIEQDADVIMLLHHPDPEANPTRLDLIVEKNRSGKRGAVALTQRSWLAAIDPQTWHPRHENTHGTDEQEDNQ